MREVISTLIYLDTNAYSRPFDDQTNADIQAEANAFLEIIDEVKNGKLLLLCSDILDFEVHNVLNDEKRTWIEDYLSVCDRRVENSDDILNFSKQIQNNCHLRARYALHIIGEARYFLSCDKKVTEMKQARCYRRLAKIFRKEYFSAMNPVLFAEKMKKGEIE